MVRTRREPLAIRKPQAGIRPQSCSIDDFRTIVEVSTDAADYPWADAVVEGVLIYGLADQRRTGAIRASGWRSRPNWLAPSWTGPASWSSSRPSTASVVDPATDAFQALIDAQRAAGVESGDHFAKPGANDRIWSALDKLAPHDPEVFVDYYANDVLRWSAPPGSVRSTRSPPRSTWSTRAVRPRSPTATTTSASCPADQAGRFPAHAHRLTAALTLQGAVAHCDMPVETGPTLYLPHSQKYGPGYLAFHDSEFTAYFDAHYVQLPLEKGDAAFFNPALFHGAGHQPLGRRPPDGQPAAGLLGLRPSHGDRRPDGGCAERSIQCSPPARHPEPASSSCAM